MLLESKRNAVAFGVLAANLGSLLLCLGLGSWYYWAWATFGVLYSVTGLLALPVGIGLLFLQVHKREPVVWSLALLVLGALPTVCILLGGYLLDL